MAALTVAPMVLLAGVLAAGSAFAQGAVRVQGREATPTARPQPGQNSPLLAQDPGQVRTQLRDVTPGAPDAGGSGSAGGPLDPREEMRRLIQAISTFARARNPNFIVLVKGGLDLLTKSADGDDTKAVPARAYLKAIDGVLQDGVFFGVPEIDKLTPPERRDPLIARLDLARANGLAALVIDLATGPAAIDDAYRRIAAKGYLGFVAPGPVAQIDAIPRLPTRPTNENSNHILSLKGVRNFLYLSDSSRFGRQDEFALRLHQTNFDMVVVDVFHGRTPLTRQAVETLKYKALGARRLVLAQLNVGRAASYRYYWQADWREGSPLWISAPHPSDPDSYFVEYWRPAWKQIVAGNEQSYLFGLIAQGFDGVVIDGADTYRFFEGGIEAVLANP